MKKVLVGMMFVSIVYAGGWDHPVQGIQGLGMGDAYTALAEDATAIWWNPAGLSFQKSMLDVNIGGALEMPMQVYKFPDPTSPTQEKQATSNLVTFVPQAFISYKLNKLGLGFGYYVAYGGGGVDWKKEDIGYDLYSVLGVMSFTPAFSYKVSEKLGIGGRINAFYSNLENRMQMVQPSLRKIKDNGNGWAFSGGLGILYKQSEKLSFGVNFRGPFTLNLSGTHEEDTLQYDTKSKADFPVTFDVGLGVKPIPGLTLGLDIEYTTWSALDYFITTVKTPMGDMKDTTSLLFENAFKLKFGGEYAFPLTGIALRAGVAYDKAASPDSTLSPANIDVDKFVIFGGIGYEKANIGIDLAILKAIGTERKYNGYKYNMNPTVIGIALKYRI